MSLTTIDPPELMRFIRKYYPDVTLNRPDINFYNLIIKKKMLPSVHQRYCCNYLKEQAGANSVVILGIRKFESWKRNRRNEFENYKLKFSGAFDHFNSNEQFRQHCLHGKDRFLLSPILNWTNSDVWTFIRGHELPYCELYDQGYYRIGCVLCPMCSLSTKRKDIERYPGIVRHIKKSIEVLLSKGQYLDFNHSVDDVFEYYVSKKSASVFLANKHQLNLF